MNHEYLLSITKDMPCKTIEINGKPYLSRYFAGSSVQGGQWWLHQYHSADGERHLHTHPWRGRSLILCGGYIEEFLQCDGRMTNRRYFNPNPGHYNMIYTTTLHRIAEVEPNTWTLLYIEPGRLETWKFIDDDGAEQIMQASPEDWYLDHGARA